MRILTAAAVALTLAGCQQMGKMPVMQRPQVNVVHQPVIVPPPVAAPETTKPATFKQRFRQGFGRIKWLHKK